MGRKKLRKKKIPQTLSKLTLQNRERKKVKVWEWGTDKTYQTNTPSEKDNKLSRSRGLHKKEQRKRFLSMKAVVVF